MIQNGALEDDFPFQREVILRFKLWVLGGVITEFGEVFILQEIKW